MNYEEIKNEPKNEPKEDVVVKEAQTNSPANNPIPDGYIRIDMPTEGRFYAPAHFHVRDLAAEDLLGIALSDDDMLPIHTIDVFNDLIYEDGVDVGTFNDEEVVVMLFDIFTTFYSTVIKGHPYVLQESDYAYLASTLGGAESDAYRQKIRDYKNKRWNPTIDIDLTKIKKLKLPEDFSPVLKLERKKTGFSCKYSFPAYGDIKVVKDFLDSAYRQQDDLYAGLTNTLKYRKEQLQKREEGADIAFESIPNLTAAQSKEYDRYTYDRNITLMKAIRANRLLEYRGHDISNLSLGQKLEIATDPEFDLPVYQAISKKIDNTPIGLEKTIKVISPVTGEEIDYPFSFRVYDLLAAIQNVETDDLEVSYS